MKKLTEKWMSMTRIYAIRASLTETIILMENTFADNVKTIRLITRRIKMKNNNYASFFKTKPKKVETYIRCRKCGGNMEWSRGFPPQIKCTKCGYTVYPQPYEPDCTKLPETLEEYFELCEKIRRKNG